MKDGKNVNVDQNHGRSVVVLDHFRNFKGTYLIVEYNIGNDEGIILFQGKRKLLFEIKKIVKN